MNALPTTLALLTLFLAHGAGSTDERPPYVGRVERDLAEHINRGSVACGFVPLGQPVAEAVRCAVENLAAARPFHVAFQHLGADSVVWEIVVADASGVARIGNWDSDPTGGRRLRPELSFVNCQNLRFSAEIDDPVSCITP